MGVSGEAGGADCAGLLSRRLLFRANPRNPAVFLRCHACAGAAFGKGAECGSLTPVSGRRPPAPVEPGVGFVSQYCTVKGHSEFIMKLMTVSSLLALSLLAACSTSAQREMTREVLSNYSSYTGEPVSQFSMHTRFDGWTAVDNEHVLVHTNVNETRSEEHTS